MAAEPEPELEPELEGGGRPPPVSCPQRFGPSGPRAGLPPGGAINKQFPSQRVQTPSPLLNISNYLPKKKIDNIILIGLIIVIINK